MLLLAKIPSRGEWWRGRKGEGWQRGRGYLGMWKIDPNSTAYMGLMTPKSETAFRTK